MFEGCSSSPNTVPCQIGGGHCGVCPASPPASLPPTQGCSQGPGSSGHSGPITGRGQAHLGWGVVRPGLCPSSALSLRGPWSPALGGRWVNCVPRGWLSGALVLPVPHSGSHMCGCAWAAITRDHSWKLQTAQIYSVLESGV